MQAPFIHPNHLNHDPIIRNDAEGQRTYLLIPNGVKNFTTKEEGAVVSFQYRRLDAEGNIKPRIRMSKKQRLRQRRSANHRKPQPTTATSSQS